MNIIDIRQHDDQYMLTPKVKKYIGRIGLVQMTLGVICTALGSFLLPLCLLKGPCGTFLGITGYPIWSGIVFSMTGAYGWECYKKQNKSNQVSLFVLSIMSAMLCGIVFSLAVIDSHFGAYFNYGGLLIEATPSRVKTAFSIIFAISGIIQAVLSIIVSIFCCRVYGCCQS